MSDRTEAATTPTGDYPSDRINAIDDLAEAIYADQGRYDRGLSWADSWEVARVTFDAGWRPRASGSGQGTAP